jgi:hypothetical protein
VSFPAHVNATSELSLSERVTWPLRLSRVAREAGRRTVLAVTGLQGKDGVNPYDFGVRLGAHMMPTVEALQAAQDPRTFAAREEEITAAEDRVGRYGALLARFAFYAEVEVPQYATTAASPDVTL